MTWSGPADRGGPVPRPAAARPSQIRPAAVPAGHRGGRGGHRPAATQDRRGQPARQAQPRRCGWVPARRYPARPGPRWCHGRGCGRRPRNRHPDQAGHGWPGGLAPGDRLPPPAGCHSPAPPGKDGQALGKGRSARGCQGWCAARCPGSCAARCLGADENRRCRAVSRAARVARTGPAGDRSGRASRPASHHVTGPPTGIPDAHPWRRPARSLRSGSSRFLARSPPAVATPVPPAAWDRSPPAAWGRSPSAAWDRSPSAAWAGNGAAPARCRTFRASDHPACGQPRPRASVPTRAGDLGLGRVAHLVDRTRSAPATAGQPTDRAAPASYPTATGNPRAGRSTDRHACAAGHPAHRPVDRAPPAVGQPGWAGAAADRPGWAGAAADRPGRAGAAADRPGRAGAAASRAAGHPVALRPGIAAGRSTGHPAVPRPGTAAGRSRSRNRRAAPARDPDTGCWRAHGAGESRVGASHPSPCCALSPGQTEITTSCGTQAFARRHSDLPPTFGHAGWPLPQRPSQPVHLRRSRPHHPLPLARISRRTDQVAPSSAAIPLDASRNTSSMGSILPTVYNLS